MGMVNGQKFNVVYVIDMPPVAEMNTGEIFISLKHRLCNHLCPCGCSNEVSIPLAAPGETSPEEWAVDGPYTSPTFSPSLLNRFDCKSHYFIKNGKVEWA